MASTKNGGRRPVESHYDVIRFRQNMQFQFCYAKGLEPLVPGDGTCSRCYMNVYSYTPPNVTEYFGNQRIRTCPWCGRSLALAQADEMSQQQIDMWRIKGAVYPDKDAPE